MSSPSDYSSAVRRNAPAQQQHRTQSRPEQVPSSDFTRRDDREPTQSRPEQVSSSDSRRRDDRVAARPWRRRTEFERNGTRSSLNRNAGSYYPQRNSHDYTNNNTENPWQRRPAHPRSFSERTRSVNHHQGGRRENVWRRQPSDSETPRRNTPVSRRQPHRPQKRKPHERTFNWGDDHVVDRQNRSKPIKNNSHAAAQSPKARNPTTTASASSIGAPPQQTSDTTAAHLNDNDFPALAKAPPPAKTARPTQLPRKTNATPQVGTKKAPPNRSQSNPRSVKKQKLMAPPPKKKIESSKQQSQKPQNDGRDANQFLLLDQNAFLGKEVQKGRQRVRPRKKKFTTLKKRVLQERLEQWKRAHPKEATSAVEDYSKENEKTISSSCVVCLRNYVQHEDLEDEDEQEEIRINLNSMATEIGSVVDVFFMTNKAQETDGDCCAFVLFEEHHDAEAARACWDGLSIGGQRSRASLIPIDANVSIMYKTASDGMRDEWRRKIMSASLESFQTSAPTNMECEARDKGGAKSVVLANILTKEDFDDKDELEESLADIRSMAETCGTVTDIQATQEDATIVVSFDKSEDATHGLQKFSGLVIGGQIVSATLFEASDSPSAKPIQVEPTTVALHNILTQDDLEDEDALEESVADIRRMAQEVGPLVDVQASTEAGGILVVRYEGQDGAKRALQRFSGLVIGGQTVVARLHADKQGQGSADRSSPSWIVLKNLLTDDDLEDEDCLEETRCDVVELASHYGNILSVVVDVQNGGLVRIQYDGDHSVASLAARKFDGMVIGGQTISATVVSENHVAQAVISSCQASNIDDNEPTVNKPSEPTPMFSGDKLIPERFAECKRVPKIPNAAPGPRHYATVVDNETVKPLLVEMLGELMRLQKRAMEDKNAKARRRIVMGLREVARGIRSHKVKLVIMANNLDQYGVIDEKLQGILDLSKQEGVPVFFEFSKRALGKAVRKSIKVSVVGIQNAEGAHQQFKKLVSLAPTTTATV